MKKLFLLAIIMLLLPSCKQNGTADISVNEEDCIIYNNVPVYTIVRGDESSDAVTKAAVYLRKRIEEITGVKVDIKTDWVKKGEDISLNRDKYEILIGPTNRAESIELYEKYSAGVPMDYMIGKSGDYYIIAGGDDFIMEAAETFVSNTELISGGVLKMADNINIEKTHVFPVDRLTSNGIDVGEFAIVYPAYYSKDQLIEVNGLKDYIYVAAGKKLDVISDAEAKRPHEIIIGKSRGNLYQELSGMDCVVEIDGGDIKLGGNNYYFDVKAIDMFTEEFLNYSGTGAEINLSQKDTKAYLSKNTLDIILCAWCTSGDPFVSENQIREVAECGINLINLAVPGDAGIMRDLLKWCAKYDLRVLWTDNNIYNAFTENDLSEKIRPYLYSPVTWGIYVKDEPNSADFEHLKELVDIYNGALNGGGTYTEPFINLFPLYANEEQLGNRTYLDHVRQYLDIVQPKLCSVDIYPLNSSGLYGDYMRNIDIVATESRKRGIDLSVYIQSVSFHSSKRTPSYADLKWQTYCCLSFGANSIMYFTYITPYSSAEDFSAALIDHSLNKTDRWYYAQTLNNEINAISGVFAQYKNVGAFNFNYSADYRYLDFDNQYKDFSLIENIECKNPLLFGCFEKDGAGKAFTVVNMTDLQRRGGESDVRIKLSPGKTATAYIKGIPQPLTPDGDGYISITLDVGEGVFVTCE